MTVQIGIVLLTFVIFVVLILSNKVKIYLAAMAIPIILAVSYTHLTLPTTERV